MDFNEERIFISVFFDVKIVGWLVFHFKKKYENCKLKSLDFESSASSPQNLFLPQNQLCNILKYKRSSSILPQN